MGALLVYLSVRPSRSQSGGSPVPFTAEYTETSTNPNSGVSAQKHLFWAVKSDGSRSLGSTDDLDHQRLVKDLPHKREIVLSDHAKLKTTYDYSFAFATMPPRPARIANPTCMQNTRVPYASLGEDVVAGYRTFHYQAPLKNDADGTTEDHHYWYAPDLDCFEVLLKAYKHDSTGTLTGVFEKRITRVRMGEPEPQLFEIPADYREVRPSELEQAAITGKVRTREGSDAADKLVVPEGIRRNWDALDRKYDSVKQKRLPN
jgi:hypothetical protein